VIKGERREKARGVIPQLETGKKCHHSAAGQLPLGQRGKKKKILKGKELLRELIAGGILHALRIAGMPLQTQQG